MIAELRPAIELHKLQQLFSSEVLEKVNNCKQKCLFFLPPVVRGVWRDTWNCSLGIDEHRTKAEGTPVVCDNTNDVIPLVHKEIRNQTIYLQIHST